MPLNFRSLPEVSTLPQAPFFRQKTHLLLLLAAQGLHMGAQGLHIAAQGLQMHHIAVHAVYGCWLAGHKDHRDPDYPPG